MAHSPSISWKPLAALLVLVVAFSALGTIRVGRGQAPEQGQRATVAPELKRTFFPVEACNQCHRPDFDRKSLPSQLVRFDEAQVWADRDKHSRAFDALTGPRGQQMGKPLGFKDVASERACLSCHATGFLPGDPRSDWSGAESVKAQGVSCTACHGPYQEWVGRHGSLAERNREWRSKSAQEKSRDYGMTDLRDPATRAAVCSSCHIGNAGERKVVTHAMYAAGHPPLPGFEVATFLSAMPPHWDSPEKVEAFQKDGALALRNHADPSEPPLTKAAVVGGVVALREAMRLLAAEAVDAGPPSKWPEYAQLDCYACHHELRSPGYVLWRQQRGARRYFDGVVLIGAFGRPQFRPWPLALVPLALAHVEAGGATREALLEAVKELHKAFDSRPFGDGAEVAQAARRVEAAAGSLLEALKNQPFTRGSAPKLLAALAKIPSDDFPDYESARQIACAIQAIHAEWQPRPANDAQFVELIDELTRTLRLDPYASREARENVVAGRSLSGDDLARKLLELSEEEYQSSLTRAADYDPIAFKRAMARLLDMLEGREPGPSR